MDRNVVFLVSLSTDIVIASLSCLLKGDHFQSDFLASL